MEIVILTPKEQARLQVLNCLLAEHIDPNQAAELMGISLRYTRRMLTSYRENGATALAHGLRGHKPVNTIPDSNRSRVVHLAGTIYQGANHIHLNELLSVCEGILIGKTHPGAHPGSRRYGKSARQASDQAPGAP